MVFSINAPRLGPETFVFFQARAKNLATRSDADGAALSLVAHTGVVAAVAAVVAFVVAL
jgi:hypothetical protein